MSGGYFDCACCGTVDMSSDEETTMCEACTLCDCSEDSPSCRELLVDGSHGIYVPRAFATNFNMSDWGVDVDTVTILLAGPDHADYWEAWSDVEGRTEATFDGKRWVLEQDGDLWARCVGAAQKGAES